MLHINVKDDLNLIMLDNLTLVFDSFAKIKLDNSSTVVINLFSVIIEYPGTGYILDEVFKKMNYSIGNEVVIIRTKFYQEEEELLNAIFLGSNYFNLNCNSYLKAEIIRERVSKVLRDNNFKINIEVYDNNDVKVDVYEL